MNLTDEDLEKFEDIVINSLADDPLQVIIRGHLILESKLIGLIELCLKDKKEIDIAKLRFPVKIDLAYALGAIEDKSYKSLLLHVNSLRNKFAHDFNYELKDEEVNKMFRGDSNINYFFKEPTPIGNHFMKLKILLMLLYTMLEREERRLKND